MFYADSDVSDVSEFSFVDSSVSFAPSFRLQGYIFDEKDCHPFAFGMAVLFLFISLTAPDRTSNQALLSVLSIFHEWHLFGHSHDCWSPPAQPDNTTFRAEYRAM